MITTYIHATETSLKRKVYLLQQSKIISNAVPVNCPRLRVWGCERNLTGRVWEREWEKQRENKRESKKEKGERQNERDKMIEKMR